jgi:flagellar biosynthesis regulator FlaF
VLATDLADEANALPDMLRARLLFLAEFTLLNGGRALKGRRAPTRPDRHQHGRDARPFGRRWHIR